HVTPCLAGAVHAAKSGVLGDGRVSTIRRRASAPFRVVTHLAADTSKSAAAAGDHHVHRSIHTGHSNRRPTTVPSIASDDADRLVVGCANIHNPVESPSCGHIGDGLAELWIGAHPELERSGMPRTLHRLAVDRHNVPKALRGG